MSKRFKKLRQAIKKIKHECLNHPRIPCAFAVKGKHAGSYKPFKQCRNTCVEGCKYYISTKPRKHVKR